MFKLIIIKISNIIDQIFNYNSLNMLITLVIT